MFPKNYENPDKPVAYFLPYQKILSTKSKLKIKEYVCQVSSKLLENVTIRPD